MFSMLMERLSGGLFLISILIHPPSLSVATPWRMPFSISGAGKSSGGTEQASAPGFGVLLQFEPRPEPNLLDGEVGVHQFKLFRAARFPISLPRPTSYVKVRQANAHFRRGCRIASK